jgi:hypothetical protein
MLGKTAGEVGALPAEKLNDLMGWLADFELECLNARDKKDAK